MKNRPHVSFVLIITMIRMIINKTYVRVRRAEGNRTLDRVNECVPGRDDGKDWVGRGETIELRTMRGDRRHDSGRLCEACNAVGKGTRACVP